MMFKLFEQLKMQKQIRKSIRQLNALWESDLKTIWAIDNKNDFLNAMDGWLCRKCNYGENIAALSDAEKVFYFNTQLESEVNNGGFSQFFFNSSGNFSSEISSSLNAIGAYQTVSIYKEALSALGGILPKDRYERQNLLDCMLTDLTEEILSKCDSKFYQYPDNLEELNYRYIFNNKEQFT